MNLSMLVSTATVAFSVGALLWTPRSAAAESSALAGEAAGTESCGVQRIAAGGDGARKFTCVVEAAGTLNCWGNNQFGQIDAPDGEFRDVGTGAYHACAIGTDNTIECWGNNDGLLDLEAPAGQFSKLAIGYFGPNCALRQNGTVACWGYGELVLDVRPGSFVKLSAGGEVACGLDSQGNPTCWHYAYGATEEEIIAKDVDVPSGTFAEIGVYFDGGPSKQNTHMCGRRTNGQVTCWTDEVGVAPWTAPSGTFSKLSVGGGAACGVHTNGPVECWGPDWIYEVDWPEGDFVELVSGGGQICGLTADGNVVCTGTDASFLCETPAVCGNGDVEDPEDCDDGDTSFVAGDACTSDCTDVPCGQPVHPDASGPVASDALFTLRAAVGSSACAKAVCDVDASSAVTAVDALMVLKRSVGIGSLACS